MTKKKKVDIARQLDALNPSKPTRTRPRKSGNTQHAEPKKSAGSGTIVQPPFGAVSLLLKNIHLMEKLGKSMFEDSRRFQGFFFDGFSNMLGMFYKAMHNNMHFTSEIIRRIHHRR